MDGKQNLDKMFDEMLLFQKFLWLNHTTEDARGKLSWTWKLWYPSVTPDGSCQLWEQTFLCLVSWMMVFKPISSNFSMPFLKLSEWLSHCPRDAKSHVSESFYFLLHRKVRYKKEFGVPKEFGVHVFVSVAWSVCHWAVVDDGSLNRSRNCKCHVTISNWGAGDYTATRASSVKCCMKSSVSSLVWLWLRISDHYHLDTVKFNFFFDRFNVHQELGKEHVKSLKINCVLGEKSKKNISAEEYLTGCKT